MNGNDFGWDYVRESMADGIRLTDTTPSPTRSESLRPQVENSDTSTSRRRVLLQNVVTVASSFQV